jgi:GNAT superfamily N-acetyltransferase
MPDPAFRPATMDDVALAADLMTSSYPAEPEDPLVAGYRWAHPRDGWSIRRFIGERERRPIGYAVVSHGPWDQVPERHCNVEVHVDRAVESIELLTASLTWIEEQALADGGLILHAYAAEDEPNVLNTLVRLGYEQDRREKVWELDFRVHGARLLAEAESARAKMEKEHIELLTLSEWSGPDTLEKLHALDEITVQDVPHSVPLLPQTFQNFLDRMSSPDRPPDRLWLARHVDRAVALSFLRFPPIRGNVWTGYTCSHPEYRGRGIARAVKLQSLAQAVELGIPFVRTDNDSENAPMLHINKTLGYDPRPGFVNFTKRVSVQ